MTYFHPAIAQRVLCTSAVALGLPAPAALPPLSPDELRHPECRVEIDRGMEFLCEGCALAFCGSHSTAHFCERCLDEEAFESDAENLEARLDAEPFAAKPERAEWLKHLRTDESWDEWRATPGNTAQLERWERAAAQQGTTP